MRIFKLARIKLTALYLLIIMLITLAFSAGVYSILSHEVERFSHMQRIRIEGRAFPGMPPVLIEEDSDLVAEAKLRIIFNLVLIDTGILFVSGLLAYFLAGRTLKPINDMVDEQNRFISDASHEFKTPLTALKSSFEVFLRDRSAKMPQARELVADGIKDVDNLNLLATSLLELARFESYRGNGSTFPLEMVDLGSAVEKAILSIKPLAQKKSINILYTGNSPKVIGNIDKLTQLFTILLDNAVKYSSSGKDVEVIVGNLEVKTVQVKIVDYGMGISKDDLPHIFNRFYRAEMSRSKARDSVEVDGYGLGLSIAKNIVANCGGKINVESELGKGTAVQVILRIGE